MKKWLVMFLVSLVLCGCEAPPEPETLPAVIPEGTAAVTEPTEPSGLYLPGSDLEIATGGAVRSFPLNLEHAQNIRFLGEDILVFSGRENTTLTLLSGPDRFVRSRITLPCFLSPEDPSAVIHRTGITYFDSQEHVLVFLNELLEETKRLSIPDRITGPVALSPDCSTLYYCAEGALRVLDPETGQSRLLTQMDACVPEVTGLHCGGSIVSCAVTDGTGARTVRFLCAETGALLREETNLFRLWTDGDFYIALRSDANRQELLSGSSHFGPSVLVTGHQDSRFHPVSGSHTLVISTAPPDEDTTLLDHYDLESGARIHHLTLPGAVAPTDILADAHRNLWFLNSGDGTLYCWELAKSSTDDHSTYLQSVFSMESPDHEGLQRCREQAEAISDALDIRILIWTDATVFQPWDYCLTPEYQVPLIESCLEQLEEILSRYPPGFLREAAFGSSGESLTICLVRSIEGKNGTGALTSANGIQFWDDSHNACIALIPGTDLEQTLHHELFHILENRVLCRSKAYDDWQDLNPAGFEYDWDYLKNLSREDSSLTQGPERAFIDLYSMSYPREDRARIMEYAMMSGQQGCFSSETMQKKLRTLCLGIREAFPLEDSNAPFLWEQYLKEPLGKTK